MNSNQPLPNQAIKEILQILEGWNDQHSAARIRFESTSVEYEQECKSRRIAVAASTIAKSNLL